MRDFMAKIPDPSEMDDPAKIRNLMANAKRLGHDELALRCKVRIAELAGHEYEEDLEREFWTAVHMAEEFKTEENGKTTKLSRTRQKYNRDGARKCIKDLALRKEFAPGFYILADNGRTDLTFEAVLLRNPMKFDQESVAGVRDKLISYGVPENSIDGWIHGQG